MLLVSGWGSASFAAPPQASGASPDVKGEEPPPSTTEGKAGSTEAKEDSTPAPAPPAQVQRPVPLSTLVPSVEVPPDQAQVGEDPIDVILELTIDETGAVIKARVVSGEEPYATATLSASRDFRFVPAKVNGQPVVAKIHYLVSFTPPPPSTETAPDALKEETETQAPTRSSASEGQVVEEVIVLGKFRNPTGTKITRLETTNLAGAFGDPLRAIESMPGVTPIASGLPLFFVRGAPPGNVGYFIDGIRIPLLYHAFLGPSVIHPALIDSVTLHAGPMPTQFGRYAGAAVEAEMAAPPSSLRAEGSVRLIDAGAFVESPFAKNRGYVQLGGRYSYTALLISAFSPGTRLDYWDYQGRVGYRLGNQDEVSVLALGAYDYVGTNGEVVGGTEFHRIDGRWEHQFTPKDHMRLALTWGKDRTRSDLGYLSDRLLGSRLNYEHSEKDVLFRSGADVWIDSYKMDIDKSISEPETYLELFPPRTDVQAGVFTEFVLFPEGKIQVIPGIRADVYNSLGETRGSVDPRLTAQYQLTDKLRAVHSIGTAHQTPNFVPNVPGAQVAGLDGGLQKNLQASTKYEYEFPWEITASVAGFMNTTRDLTDPIGLGQSFSIDEKSKDARSLGRAWGLEFYVKRALTQRLGGLLSYTYSASYRSYGRITTRPGYDRPHVLNAALTYDIAWGLRASVKFAISSGILGRRTVGTENLSLDGFVFDQSRSAPYIRLDAKLEKRWQLSPHLDWGLYAEVLNATNTGNVTTRTCNGSGDCENAGTLPITFPLIGADVAWK